MQHTLEGDQARNVKLDGVPLLPDESLRVRDHSPDGFNWGYGGSGPAQLALAVILKLTGKLDGYQDFKWRIIAPIQPAGEPFKITFEL